MTRAGTPGGGARQRPKRAASGQRSSSQQKFECPGWFLHWAPPVEANAGRHHDGFCSVCGSRAQSRRVLDETAGALHKQVAILQEIASRQEVELSKKRLERDDLQAAARERSAAARLATDAEVAMEAEKGDLDAKVLAEQMDVERLLAELHVWREDGLRPAKSAWQENSPLVDDRAQASARQSAASSSVGLSSRTSGWSRGDGDAKAMSWAMERQHLEASIREAKDKLRALTERVAQRDARRAEAEEASRELLNGQMIIEHLHERVKALRKDLEEETRLQEMLPKEEMAEAQEIAEELAQVERRVAAETDLQRAQQVQLRSVEDTSEPLQAQIRVARQHAAELRQSLAESDDVLQRLR